MFLQFVVLKDIFMCRSDQRADNTAVTLLNVPIKDSSLPLVSYHTFYHIFSCHIVCHLFFNSFLFSSAGLLRQM